jgi:hypothetical protein
MKDDHLYNDLFLLLGYLLTSAHGLFSEPPGYGPFRLMDAASRLVAILRAHGMDDPFLAQLAQDLEAECFGSSDDQHLQQALNEFCLRYATELNRRLKNSPDNIGST